MVDCPSSSIKAVIAASVLSCDFANFQSECEKVINAGVNWLHLDLMDGHFVPNLTFGFPVIRSLRKKMPATFFDCHCMISQPARWVKELASSGANQMIFHYESEIPDIKELCKSIKAHNMRVAISIKPKTELDEELFKLIEEKLVDMVLIMTVEPGFGGQKFMEEMMPKVKKLREKFPTLDIEVDGGIDETNVEAVAKAGANVIVSGTGIYDHEDPRKVISEMRRVVNEYVIMH